MFAVFHLEWPTVLLSPVCRTSFTPSQISENGQLYTWGGNEHGQLGLGNHISRNTPQLVSHFTGQTVVVAKCGGMHTAAQLGTTTHEFLKRNSTRYRQILYMGTK